METKEKKVSNIKDESNKKQQSTSLSYTVKQLSGNIERAEELELLTKEQGNQIREWMRKGTLKGLGLWIEEAKEV